MSLDVVFPPADACVWMEAGVIRYWLCCRNFDCEHCPLDAALRDPAANPPERTDNPTTFHSVRTR